MTLSSGISIGAATVGDFALENAPVELLAGNDYTFLLNDTGAAVQGYLTSLEFNAVPEPSSSAALLCLTTMAARRRRQRA